MMVFSGRIPFGVLPEWMYHAQVPPPTHKFNPELPGITWVDLVFPFFLFAMGAAIPLALSRRIERGDPRWKIFLSIFYRGIQLAAFAIYVMHIRPWLVEREPTAMTWVACLLGFLLLFPMFARLPGSWSKGARAAVRSAGWIGAVALMALLRFSDGSGFSLNRSDIIILVLSNVAVAGGIIWILTRDALPVRLGLLGFLLALRLGSGTEGWVQWVWNASPVPWLFQVRFLQYLFITIPGTIIGDYILEWMKFSGEAERERRPPVGQLALLALLMVVINIVVVVGLKTREIIWTMTLAGTLCVGAWYLLRGPTDSTARLNSRIFSWALFWLFLGFVFEPFEGGIKKDHATLSYYFVTTGLAIMVLIAFTVVVDMLKIRRGFGFLIATGQNPLVAYAGVNSLVPPVLGLLRLDTIIESLTPTPWLGVLRGAFMSYLVALASNFCAKRGIFLKT